MTALGVYEEEHLERLLRVATCLAMCGYGAQVGQLAGAARAFYSDAQVWAAQVHHRGSAYGRTHLMHAAHIGSAARLQYLLDRGAAVDAVDIGGVTALMLASESAHLEIARCLLERGAANVNAADCDGMTSLMCASQNGHLEIVRFLVERDGATVNAAQTDDGYTALMWASQMGYLEIVRLLVHRAGLNINAADSHGYTALHLACSGGLEAVAGLLVSRGADPSLLDNQGRSALFFAQTSAARLQALLAPGL